MLVASAGGRDAAVNLLALYDQQRFGETPPGLRREELPSLVRLVDLVGSTGTVIYSNLTSESVDQAIEEQID